MEHFIDTHSLDDPDLISTAYNICTKYSEAAGALAAEWYDTVAEMSGVSVPLAEVADTPDYGEVAKAINGTRKTGNPKTVSDSISRLVKRTGVDTTMKNAIRDGAQWAWIPHGDTCSFCLTLASRGWQPASKSQMKGDHAEHIHANCDCTFAIRFGNDTKYAGYDPDKYLEMYNEAEGRSAKDKINAMRRAHYAENKDKINAQKRMAYAARKNRLMIAAQTEGDAKIPESLVGNFDDYAPLDLSDQEINALKALHSKALENDCEYGKIIYNEGETDILTSNQHDKVALPVEQTEGTGLRVLHSHTNDTPPSSADFKPLIVNNVDRIEVVSANGDVWVVDIADGYRPTKEDLDEQLMIIKSEVIRDLQNEPEFFNWTPEERNYMVVREKLRLILQIPNYC